MSGLGNDILDSEVMRQSFGDDKGFACDSMTLYLRDAPGRLRDIRESVDNDDNEALATSAHALKGMTGYYNRETPYTACLALEMLGREKGLPDKRAAAVSQLSMLEIQIQIIMRKMTDYLAANR